MMSEPDFDAELEIIQRRYGERRDGAEALLDQALARLFDRCGWTQERIAKKVGKSQQWVHKRLVFGRFLLFTTSGSKSQFPTEKLTERRFRDFWGRTRATGRKLTERQRFAAVAELLAERHAEPPPRYKNLVEKPGFTPAAVQLLQGKRRWTPAEILEALREQFPGIEQDQVGNVLQGLKRRPPKGFVLDARHCGREHSYRLAPRRQGPAPAATPAEAGEALADVQARIDEALAELKKSPAAMCHSLIAEHLVMIKRRLCGLQVPAEVA